MKFTVERVTLERMVAQVMVDRGAKGPRQRMMRLSAGHAQARVAKMRPELLTGRTRLA
jgi:hypothetical protein